MRSKLGYTELSERAHFYVWRRTLGTYKITKIETLTPRQAQQLRASTETLFWHDVPVQPE